MVRFALIGALVACALTYRADAHGAMSFPETRNTVTSHYCPQCANGKNVCGAEGGSQWPADAAGSKALNSAYTTPLTQLIAGGRVDVEIYFTATHQGHFVLELCQNPGSTITEDCFVRLERDPTDTRYGPYASAAPTIGYLPTNQCAGQFSSPGNPLRMRFKIPAGATTGHGILRWFWQTGNSCDSSPYTTNSGAPSSVTSWTNQLGSQTCRAVTTGMGTSCGSNCPSTSCNGEQFKNCADVSVVIGDPNTIVTSGNHNTDPGNGGGDGGNGGGDGGNGGEDSGNGGGDGGNGGGDGGNGGEDGGNGGGDGGNGGGDGDNGGGATGPWADQLANCIANVKGIQPWWDIACQEFCLEGVNDPFYATFCATKGITQLTPCVLDVRTAACKQA